MTTAYIALGSNVGNRLEQIRAALKSFRDDYGLKIVALSPVYENRAIGMGDADPFLNAVVKVETELGAEALLEACLSIESKLGRVRTGVWAPRTIDLDILIYGDIERRTERLNLPHPRIAERDFVAKPLSDVAPDLLISGKRMSEIYASLDSSELTLYKEHIQDFDRCR